MVSPLAVTLCSDSVKCSSIPDEIAYWTKIMNRSNRSVLSGIDSCDVGHRKITQFKLPFKCGVHYCHCNSSTLIDLLGSQKLHFRIGTSFSPDMLQV
jgi:hypothetical protein